MANYSIEKMKQDSDTGKGLGVVLGGGLAILLAKAFIDSGNNANRIQKKQDIQYRITQINHEISSYKSKFMGGFLYNTEIAELEEEKAQLQKELNSL